jgi:hypothetical protein
VETVSFYSRFILVADRGIIPAEGKLVNSGKADFTGFSGILKDFRAFEAWGMAEMSL